MERVWTTELASVAGQRVRVCGWVHHVRRLARVTFVLLRDGRGIAQLVVEDGSADALAPETVICVLGNAVLAAAALGGVEVHDPVISVLSVPAATPPFELRRPSLAASLPTILDNAAVALRHPARREVFRIAAASVAGFRRALDEMGFTEIHTPKVVASATEGGANVFALNWFGRRAFLAQSPQFYKQTMVGVFERVYEVGPVFRAEPHDTARHLAEYVSLDAELGFITDHRDVMAVLTEVVRSMASAVGAAPPVPATIPSVMFADALRMMDADPAEPDLSPAHERWLGEWAVRDFGSDFLFVVGYPMAKRPFYTHPDPTDPAVSNSFDLLYRGVELVTGGQRLHRYQDYVRVLAGQDLAPYAGYLDAFRYGMPPHGGFAIGLERWVARVTGAANVREVTLFPRDLHRLTP